MTPNLFSRATTGEIIFWGAGALALALYALTVPDGLPWNESVAAVTGGAFADRTLPHQAWRYFVAVFDGHFIALSCTAAAVAAGLLGALVNRYLGWRVALSASLVWTTLPAVWCRAVTGERTVCYAAAGVAALWFLNALGLFMTRKARAARRNERQWSPRLMRGGRVVAWSVLGAGALLALGFAVTHDYRYGEAASAYARLVVGEAGDRMIILNGLCDAQIEREGARGGVVRVARARAGDRTNLVAWAKAAFPTETNLWVAAQVGPALFVESAFGRHSERFYSMNGHSTTAERLSSRRQAMLPYLSSDDPFIPALRRAFDREADVLATPRSARASRARHADVSPSASLTNFSIAAFKTLSDLHAEMMKHYYGKRLDEAANVARTILSQRDWMGFVPAYVVLGTATAVQGDFVASETFYRVAVSGKGKAAPARFVFNDYADVLRHLRRYDEAEKYARKAIDGTEEREWVYRLTLAQVLRDAQKGKLEIKALVEAVLRHAPESERERIRKEFAE